MSEQDIEIILCRHWTSHLMTPAFIVDPEGNLVFFNEPAEPLLGRRFSEMGEMRAEEWSRDFEITDEDGTLIAPEKLPLVIALTERRPAHQRFWALGLDHIRRHVETTCFPLIGRTDQLLGALAFFWEIED